MNTTLSTMIMLAMAMAGATACTPKPADPGASLRARELFTLRCAGAGEKIVRTVDNVPAILVMKIRPGQPNLGDQFTLDDPYGADHGGQAYIGDFLRGAHDVHLQIVAQRENAWRWHRPIGYRFAEAVDPREGVRYRYTGRVEQPWRNTQDYRREIYRYFVDAVPATGPAPRYGVTYDDISTPEDRKLWIAGSSLKVIDLQTHEVIAERIGYMVDIGQGSTAGGRSPWQEAASNACPAFGAGPRPFTWQYGQAAKFVEQVLRPAAS